MQTAFGSRFHMDKCQLMHLFYCRFHYLVQDISSLTTWGIAKHTLARFSDPPLSPHCLLGRIELREQ